MAEKQRPSRMKDSESIAMRIGSRTTRRRSMISKKPILKEETKGNYNPQSIASQTHNCLDLDNFKLAETEKEREKQFRHLFRHFNILNLHNKEELEVATVIRDLVLEHFKYELSIVPPITNEQLAKAMKANKKPRKPTREEIRALRPLLMDMMKESKRQRDETEKFCNVQILSPDGRRRKYKYIDRETRDEITGKEYEFRYKLYQNGVRYLDHIDAQPVNLESEPKITRKLDLAKKETPEKPSKVDQYLDQLAQLTKKQHEIAKSMQNLLGLFESSQKLSQSIEANVKLLLEEKKRAEESVEVESIAEKLESVTLQEKQVVPKEMRADPIELSVLLPKSFDEFTQEIREENQEELNQTVQELDMGSEDIDVISDFDPFDSGSVSDSCWDPEDKDKENIRDAVTNAANEREAKKKETRRRRSFVQDITELEAGDGEGWF